MKLGHSKRNSTFSLLLNLGRLTYTSTVRKVRQSHGNAIMALAMNILQAVLFIVAFYFMFTVLGTRGMTIRGDFLIYLLTGIFLYLTHVKALGAVVGAEGPASAMMLHAPMNTLVAILSSALSALYLQTLALGVILLGIHTIFGAVEIHDWAGVMFMFLLSWASGCAVGLVFLALKPWFPDFVSLAQTIYTRANMIASGKMFVANALPAAMIPWFSWNPLFHLIDQARGFAFNNYFPHVTNWQYPIYFTLAFVMLGLMGDFYTRKRVSASWMAGR
ncbi:ABC transporter permease [Rhodobacteraceae bacterium W635]|uniref:ABC transporter permease n=1 Tax=Nioella halotolerans TaxID=2303578 RepID=UPI000E3CE2B4|nr:ABC transporter permease [Rhodobacteraceae bacterium W635]